MQAARWQRLAARCWVFWAGGLSPAWQVDAAPKPCSDLLAGLVPESDLCIIAIQVYKGLRRGVQEVAVKKLARNTAEDVWFKLLTNEIDVLKKVCDVSLSAYIKLVMRILQPYQCSGCPALTRELSACTQVSYDRNIVQYYGACLQDQASAMLVMEYMAVRTPY